ncbi:trans-AT polyketide synthase, acyltransferase and oxidoreductase domains [Gammaproteobacteria bacterium]
MNSSGSAFTPLGTWIPGQEAAVFAPAEIGLRVKRIREVMHLVRHPASGHLGLAHGGSLITREACHNGVELQWLATFPALYPEWLGDRSFGETHKVRFAYVAGEMANGISTPALVIAMARAGMLGFYGAGGLSPERIEAGLDEIQGALRGSGLSYGVNLIHSPQEPELEETVAQLLSRRGVPILCASAYMSLTPSVVRLAATGLSRDREGRILRKHRLFAKLSRPEVARLFASPAPQEMLQNLVSQGELTEQEAALASVVPLVEDITVEADSGGHTDNRPLAVLFPTIRQVVDEIAQVRGYARPIRIGAAGGLGTPSSVAAAFGLGAAYVVTGSINQSTKEAGISEISRKMLAQADLADMIMAPSADMFELGMKVQVLRRGTMFAQRALRLHQMYEQYDSPQVLPAKMRQELEADVFHASFDDVWLDIQRFFAKRDPKQIERAKVDGKHHLALLCRWYLGQSSRWAIEGDPTRRLDYQLWCGPAMGAFNAWVKGSFLEDVAQRSVVQVALNLLEGAAISIRASQLRACGLPVPVQCFDMRPRPLR